MKSVLVLILCVYLVSCDGLWKNAPKDRKVFNVLDYQHKSSSKQKMLMQDQPASQVSKWTPIAKRIHTPLRLEKICAI